MPKRITRVGEPHDETWYLETKKRIREAFQLFDKDRKGCVVQKKWRRSCGTLARIRRREKS